MLSGVNFRSTALVCLLMIMVLAPLTTAEPAENGLELQVEIEVPENGMYHSDSSDLEVTLRVKNHANQARELTYNPACPFDLILTNADWQLDLDDERICPTQSRAMMIQPGQSRIISTWTWDWSDAPSGEIELEFTQPDAELLTSDSLILHRTVEMPEYLEFNAILAETIGEQIGHTSDMPAMIHLSLSNSGTEEIVLPFDANCRVQTNVLTTIPCGTGTLSAGESFELGWVSWNFAEFADGDYTIPFGLTGVVDAASSVNTMYTATPTNPVPALIPTTSVESGETLAWHFTLQNTEDAPAKMLFEDNCIVEMHVISPQGEIVYDSRESRSCLPSGNAMRIPSLSTHTLVSDSWDYIGDDGCEIGDGLHLLVLSQPDHTLVSTQSFLHTHSGQNPTCGIDNQDTSDIRFSVDNLVVLDADGIEERIAFDLTILNTGSEEFEFYWPTDCTLELQLSLVGSSPHRVWNEGCDDFAGHETSIEPLTSQGWATIEVPFVEDGIELADGTWQLSIQTTSVPSFTTYVAHTYDGVHLVEIIEEVSTDPIDESVDSDENFEEISELILSGDWNYVTTSTDGCWLLTEATGIEHSFITHMQDGAWTPTPGLSGTYLVESGKSANACSVWSGVVILETLDETETAPEILVPMNPTTPPSSPVDQIIEFAPSSVAVVATTSLSIMTLLYLGNTEWIRIPALQVGLGIIGMVRKNGEHDGEYQRGRIMGYLTANPGVHFRALLGALDMSNGQLTHHLKNLEGSERIWRRKDGRLVRFYPASIQSSLEDDDLPVPLLTPDPNSLQGKILRLLDATENDIVNLSQKELAVRLEASQQLVSHHLRTLEKFGLVEREKVGMRYRYQLTREAIFLVNSNAYDVTHE